MAEIAEEVCFGEGVVTSRERVVVFQIGSLGDTVISIPCYREIARRHPDAERLLLTNISVGGKMVQAEAILRPAGLIEGTVEYPMPLRGLRNIFVLFRRLRALRIDVLYYLMPEKKWTNVLRHFLFLKVCGVRAVRGLPWRKDLRQHQQLVPGTLWETEGSRLLRTLLSDRAPGAPPTSDRALDLNDSEREKAKAVLAGMQTNTFIAFSVGGRIPVKDWGDENWSAVLRDVSREHPSLGIAFVGSKDEYTRCDRLATFWDGPTLNACGRLTPRETAALIERAALFLGHDTGTMHLAAAVDTRALGLFCARDVPGLWYTDRPGDHFFYEQPSCFGCGVSERIDCHHGLVCMTSHRREVVVNVVAETLRRGDNRNAIREEHAAAKL